MARRRSLPLPHLVLRGLLFLVPLLAAHAFVPPASPPTKTKATTPSIEIAPPAPLPAPTTTTCGAPLTPAPPSFKPHQDSALDRLLIGLLADKLAEMVPQQQTSARPASATRSRPPASFREFALSTKALLSPRSAANLVADQNAAGDAHLLRRSQQIADTLSGLVPPPLRVAFRLTGKSRLACELHALLAPLVSGWLVGPARRVEGEVVTVEGGERRREVWTSSTRIEQCRYYAESNCRKACVYLCKVPTQRFFSETLGTPLTLTPDFEDGSCIMSFGSVPLPLDEDPVMQATRALGSCCGMALSAAPAAAATSDVVDEGAAMI